MELKDIPDFKKIKRMALLAQKQWGVNTDQLLSTRKILNSLL